MPFENKIDKTIFFDAESKVAISEKDLKIMVQTIESKKTISFKDKEGNKFSKSLD